MKSSSNEDTPGTSILESGALTVFYRPRVDESDVESLNDVQRLFLLIEPEDAPRARLIAIGRKRLPSSSRRERFWGFVDMVLPAADIHTALGAQTYETKTRGTRHAAAAVAIASGTYRIEHHDETHGHLVWSLERIEESDPVARELEPEAEAQYIVTVANPDAAAWGLEEFPPLQQELFDDIEVHSSVPATFPQALQERFAERRYVPLDTAEWLDHEGAELVFIGVARKLSVFG